MSNFNLADAERGEFLCDLTRPITIRAWACRAGVQDAADGEIKVFEGGAGPRLGKDADADDET